MHQLDGPGRGVHLALGLRWSMKYKLLAIDVDGTLLNSSSQLTPATAAAVRRAQERGSRLCWPQGAAWATPCRWPGP